jgi:hypothetical protein
MPALLPEPPVPKRFPLLPTTSPPCGTVPSKNISVDWQLVVTVLLQFCWASATLPKSRPTAAPQIEIRRKELRPQIKGWFMSVNTFSRRSRYRAAGANRTGIVPKGSARASGRWVRVSAGIYAKQTGWRRHWPQRACRGWIGAEIAAVSDSPRSKRSSSLVSGQA